MPKNTIYVGRPTRWGNRNEVYNGNYEMAVAAYRRDLLMFKTKVTLEEFEEWLKPLRGKNLACWCPKDKPCHADILLQFLNGQTKREN